MQYVCYVHCILYNVHCTLYSVQCTLYNIQRTLYIVHLKVSIPTQHKKLNTIQCTLYTAQRTVYSVHRTLVNLSHFPTSAAVFLPFPRVLRNTAHYTHPTLYVLYNTPMQYIVSVCNYLVS